MRDRLATTWLVRMAVMVVLVATLFAMPGTTVSARHDQGVPAVMCEHIVCDDLDEMPLEHITPSATSSLQPPMPTQPETLVVLRLSPVIFQPPEAASPARSSCVCVWRCAVCHAHRSSIH